MDCIFCSIVQGKIPAKIVYEDDDVLAFADVAPQAPLHYLFIPRLHLSGLPEVEGEGYLLIQKIYKAINEVARKEGLHENGFRVVMNSGADGGQTVGHLHFHLLGKRHLQWPPG